MSSGSLYGRLTLKILWRLYNKHIGVTKTELFK